MRQTRRSWTTPLVITLAAALVATAALVLTPGDAPTDAPAEPPAGTAAPAPAAAPAEAEARLPRRTIATVATSDDAASWALGEARTYAYTATRTVEVRAQDSGTQRMTIGLSGQWVATATDREDDQLHVRAQLREPAVDMDGPRDADRAALLAALATPYFFTLGPDGRVEATHFPPGVDAMPRMMLKAIATQLQFVRPEAAAGRGAWTVEEPDLTGEAVVRYVALEEPGGFRKAKRRYTRVATTEGMLPPERVGRFLPRHGAELWLDDDGRVASAHAKGSLTVEAGGGMFRVTSGEDARLELRSTRQTPAQLGAFARTWEGLETHAVAAGDDLATAETQQPLPADVTVASVLTELGRLDGRDGQAEVELVATLGQLFTERPGALDEARRELVDGVPIGQAKAVVAGMGHAGTAAAQTTLAGIAGHPDLAIDLRENATQALALNPKPTAETVASLTALLDDPEPDVAGAAALALGAAARVADDDAGDPFLALVDKMRQAETLEEQVLYLEAIGNSGDPRAFALLKDALSHPHPMVRSAAVGALRFVPKGEADLLITATLLGDGDAWVRRQAVLALTFRPLPPAMGALGTALTDDPATVVRSEVAGLLGRRFEEATGIGELLTWSAEHDPEESVRIAAQAALASAAL